MGMAVEDERVKKVGMRCYREERLGVVKWLKQALVLMIYLRNRPELFNLISPLSYFFPNQPKDMKYLGPKDNAQVLVSISLIDSANSTWFNSRLLTNFTSSHSMSQNFEINFYKIIHRK